jgi:hypothetical protein
LTNHRSVSWRADLAVGLDFATLDATWISSDGRQGTCDARPMEPYVDNIVTFRVLLGGYERAVERFVRASKTRDPVQVFSPLFEALNWAVALDDQAGSHWAPEGTPLGWAWRKRVSGGEVVNAIWGARNRVHHQWADALILSEGFSFPVVLPMVTHEWRWRPLSELPEPDRPAAAGADAHYEQFLAGRPARMALAELRVPFRQLAEL